MKKGKIIILILALILLAMFLTGITSRDVQIMVDGQRLNLDTPAYVSPEGRTMVPLRGVLEAMGARVSWEAADKAVLISTVHHSVRLVVGQKTAMVDGKTVNLDAPPVIKNDRVFVPLRFVGQAISAGVEWHGDTRTVRLTSPPKMLFTGSPPTLSSDDPGPGPYDVIVVSGEPEGVAAAIGAARAGARVLLVEKRDGLGGLMTYGWLNSIDMNYGPGGVLLTQGVFKEFFDSVGGDSFDVQHAKGVFAHLVTREPNIKLLLSADFTAPVMEDTAITGVTVRHQGQRKAYRAPRVIDATPDADVAAAAGVPHTLGASDRGLSRGMVPTLVYHVGGVDWSAIVRALNHDNDPGTGANQVSAWGFWPEIQEYQPRNPRIRVRGPNIGRQHDGSVLINALQIFDVDPLDSASRAEAMAIAQAEMPHLVEFMRQRVPGFQNAYLMGTAPELYIRESRHIIGEYVLNINDVLENRDFWDRIAFGSYPVDIQATDPTNWGFAMGNPVKYAIPYRSIVPLKVDNLLVVGRAASFTSLAAGSARVIPIGMATGQAAGVAAAHSLSRGLSPRDLIHRPGEIAEIQRKLEEQGAYLTPSQIPNPLADHWAYPYLRALRPLAVVAGGYNNDWQLDQVITTESFIYLTINTMERLRPGRLDRRGLITRLTKEPLDVGTALSLLLMVRGMDGKDVPADAQGLFNYFVRQGWLSPAIQDNWNSTEPLTRGMAYALLVETLHQMGWLEIPPMPDRQ